MSKVCREFDLEERLIDFAVRVIRTAESLPKTKIGNHISGQLIRSGTSPAPNYGEAQSAESRADFIHKMRLALKELRETRTRLRNSTFPVRHSTLNQPARNALACEAGGYVQWLKILSSMMQLFCIAPF